MLQKPPTVTRGPIASSTLTTANAPTTQGNVILVNLSPENSNVKNTNAQADILQVSGIQNLQKMHSKVRCIGAYCFLSKVLGFYRTVPDSIYTSKWNHFIFFKDFSQLSRFFCNMLDLAVHCFT